MDRNERMGLDTDDDDKLGFSGDEDGGDDTVVAVVDSDVDLLMSNLKDGVICPPVCYWYTGKLGFLCFGPVSKFYSPILSMGGSRNLSTEERKKGSRASIRKIQEEKAVIEHVTGIGRGITQQNRMQFGLMAQNEDSAAQAHRDMRLVTIMKRAELTQKMSKWEMGRRRRKSMNRSKTCLINQRIFRLSSRMLDRRRECVIRSF